MPKNITSGILKNILGFRTQAQKDIKAAKDEKKRQAREEGKYTSAKPNTSLLTRGGKRRRTRRTRRRTKRRGTKGRRTKRRGRGTRRRKH